MKPVLSAAVITLLSLALYSSFDQVPATLTYVRQAPTSTPAVVPRETAKNTPTRTQGIGVIHPATTSLNSAQEALRDAVAIQFDAVPQMLAVVACESGYRQFAVSGAPLISRTDDVGVMQINIPTWGKTAKALGLDIYHSAADNIKMGEIVYQKQGIKAWTCAG